MTSDLPPNRLNPPEPASATDRIVMRATELLDADEWDDLSDQSITIRGAEILLDGSAKVMIPHQRVSDLIWSRPTMPVATAFMGAYERAMARRREALLAHVEAGVSNANYLRDKHRASLAADRGQAPPKWPLYFAGIVSVLTIIYSFYLMLGPRP